MPRTVPLPVLGAALTALAASLLLLQPLDEHVPAYLLVHFAWFVPLLVVAWEARPRSTPRCEGPPLHPQHLLSVLLWAAAMRAVLLLATPSLSDDVHRYVWEGRVVLEGLDPYDLAPDDPALADLAARAPEWARMNHRELPAVYPPLAEGLFALLAGLAADERVVRAGLVLVDLALIVVLGLALRRRGQDERLLVLYAWHPVAAVQVAAEGHYEPWALLPLALTFLMLPERGAPAASAARRSSVCFGLAAAAKYVGALPALLLLRDLVAERRGRLALACLLILLGVAALCALPFALDGTPPVGSLPEYAGHWYHFASLHALLASWMGVHPARDVVLRLFVLWTALVLWREPERARASQALMLGLLVCSPTAHPWYGLWIAVLLPLAPSVPVLLLSGLLPLGSLEASAWAPWVAYGLPLLLALTGCRGLPRWRAPSR